MRRVFIPLLVGLFLLAFSPSAFGRASLTSASSSEAYRLTVTGQSVQNLAYVDVLVGTGSTTYRYYRDRANPDGVAVMWSDSGSISIYDPRLVGQYVRAINAYDAGPISLTTNIWVAGVLSVTNSPQEQTLQISGKGLLQLPYLWLQDTDGTWFQYFGPKAAGTNGSGVQVTWTDTLITIYDPNRLAGHVIVDWRFTSGSNTSSTIVEQTNTAVYVTPTVSTMTSPAPGALAITGLGFQNLQNVHLTFSDATTLDVPKAQWNVSKTNLSFFNPNIDGKTITDVQANYSTQTIFDKTTNIPTAAVINVTGGSLAYQDVAGVTLSWGGPVGGSLQPVRYEWRTDNGSGWSSPATGTSHTVTEVGETYLQARACSSFVCGPWHPDAGTASATVRIDRSSPVITNLPFVTNSAYMSPNAGLLYYNPFMPVGETFTAHVNATTTGAAQIANVTFGDLMMSGFGSPMFQSNLGSDYMATYTSGMPGVGPIVLPVQATSVNGKTASTNLQLVADTQAPSPSALVYGNGPSKVTDQTVSWNAGTDSQSGFDISTLQRAYAIEDHGVCQGFSAWQTISTSIVAGTQNRLDANLANGCYMYRVTSQDKVHNISAPLTSSNVIQVDTTAPLGTISSNPTGPIGNLAHLSGTVADGETSVASAVLAYNDGHGNTGNICTILTSSWTCDWAIDSLPNGTYTLTLHVVDAAGNTNDIQRTLVVSNTAPIASVISLVPVTGQAYAPDTSKIFYNPQSAGSLQVNVNAVAQDTTMDHVAFPALVSGWSAGGDDSTSPYSWTYNWQASAVEPGTVNARAVDSATNEKVVPFTIVADADAPTGNSVTYTSGLQATNMVSVHVVPGADVLSGVDHWTLERQVGTWAANTCSPTGAWQTVTSQNSATTTDVLDSSLADGCVLYRVTTTDHVGNAQTVTGASAVQIDTTAPIATIDTTAGIYHGAVTVTGTSQDTGSGVASVAVSYVNSGGTATPISGCTFASTYTCMWNTSTLTDGTYSLKVTVTDLAGKTQTVTRPGFVLDNTPPYLTFRDVDTTGNPFAYWGGPIGSSTVYFNPMPIGSQTLTVRVQASDAGTGISHVDFPDISASGFAQVGAQTGPATVGTDQGVYAQTYMFGAGSTQTTAVLSATDNANNVSTVGWQLVADSTAPVNGDITYPSGLQTATNAVIHIVPGNDTQSGLASWTLQRQDGAWASGACTTTGSWVTVTSGTTSTTTNFTDTGLLDGCHQYRLLVTDHVSNTQTYTPGSLVKIDTAAPTISFTSPAAAGIYRSHVSVVTTASDTGSQGMTEIVKAGSQTLTCVTAGQLTQTCDWDTSALADGAYTLTATVTDAAGNTASATRIVNTDNTAPTASAVSFANYGYAPANVLYFNPANTGTVRASVTASDAHGIASVAYPTLGANYTAGGNSASAASPYTFDYTITAGADSQSGSIIVTDTVGNSISVPLVTIADGTAPTGGSITYTAGLQTATTKALHITPGLDSQSGLASWTVQRQDGVWASGACTTTGSWTNVTSGTTNAVVDYTDTGLANGCHTYRLITVDKVGNTQTYAAGATVSVDNVIPTVSFTAPAAGGVFRAHVTVTTTASDTGSQGLTQTLTVGAQTLACTTTGQLSATCDFDTTTVSDGTYTLTATVTDAAGNSATATRSVVVDNTAPTVGGVTFASYGYGIGNTLYFNPANTGTVVASLAASDAHGVASVAYPTLGANYSAGGNSLSSTSPYTYNYTISPGATSQSGNVTVTDTIGNSVLVPFTTVADNTAPAGGSISYTGGFQSSTSVALTFDKGTDSQSGIASFAVQRQGGTWSGATCTPAGVWTTVANSGTTYTDSSLAQGCYTYRLVVTDNVGNAQTYAPGTIVKIDNTNPTGTIANPVATVLSGNSATITGTVADAMSGPQSYKLSWTRTAPTAAGPTVLCNAPTTGAWSCVFDTTAVADGTYTLTLVAQDAVGNTATITQAGYTIDNTNPAVADPSVTTAPSTYVVQSANNNTCFSPTTAATRSFRLAVNASDVNGIQKVVFPTLGSALGTGFTEGGGAVTTPISGSTYRSNQYTFGTSPTLTGTQNIVVYDNAGRTTTYTVTFSQDSVAPAVPTVTGGNTTYANIASVAFSATAGTETGCSGGQTVNYQKAFDGAAYSADTPATSLTVTTEGQTLVRFHSIDAVGNDSGYSTVLKAVMDRTAPPVATLAGDTAGAWLNRAATFTASTTDKNPVDNSTVYVSGLPASPYTYSYTGTASASGSSASSFTHPTTIQGTLNWSIVACDVAGNCSAAKTNTTKVDTVAPTAPTTITRTCTTQGTGFTSNGASNSGWCRAGSSTLTASGSTDATSGVASYTSSSTASDTGGSAVALTATDAAGNTSAGTTGYHRLDQTAPSVVASAYCTVGGNNGWCRGAAYSSSCSDGTSGIVSSSNCNIGQTGLGDTGGWNFAASATDAAGNSASSTSATVYNDQTPPVVNSVGTQMSLYKCTNNARTTGCVNYLGAAGDGYVLGCAYNSTNCKVGGTQAYTLFYTYSWHNTSDNLSGVSRAQTCTAPTGVYYAPGTGLGSGCGGNDGANAGCSGGCVLMGGPYYFFSGVAPFAGGSGEGWYAMITTVVDVAGNQTTRVDQNIKVCTLGC